MVYKNKFESDDLSLKPFFIIEYEYIFAYIQYYI